MGASEPATGAVVDDMEGTASGRAALTMAINLVQTIRDTRLLPPELLDAALEDAVANLRRQNDTEAAGIVQAFRTALAEDGGPGSGGSRAS